MDNGKTIRRVLQLKFTLPTTEPTQFVAFIKAAEPYYELFGGKAGAPAAERRPARPSSSRSSITRSTSRSRPTASSSPATRGCRPSCRPGGRCSREPSRSTCSARSTVIGRIGGIFYLAWRSDPGAGSPPTVRSRMRCAMRDTERARLTPSWSSRDGSETPRRRAAPRSRRAAGRPRWCRSRPA